MHYPYPSCPRQGRIQSPTWCEVHPSLLVAALQGVQGASGLAGKVLPSIHALPLQVVAQVCDVVLIAIQDGCLPDAQGAAGVVALHAGIAQTLPPMPADQHRWNVVNLIGCLSTGTLLGLGDPAALAPAPASVQDHYQAQDGQQQSNHAALGREDSRWMQGDGELGPREALPLPLPPTTPLIHSFIQGQ